MSPHSSSGSSSEHIPVLVDEIVAGLQLAPGMTVVDGTLGGAGHTRQLAQAVGPQGVVLSLDRDLTAVNRARHELASLPVRLIHASFGSLEEILRELETPRVDGLLLDLGLSSDQLADGDRGFSFLQPGPLDMRFDPEQGITAADLVHKRSEHQLADLIFRFGDERFSRRIARAIVEARRQQPIKTTTQLADIVRQCIPFRGRQRLHPATRTFQALRIAVNDELAELERILEVAPRCLRPGARMAVISFHSLEDRLVKNAFRDRKHFAMIHRKPIRPSEAEVVHNPRARSARLRVAATVVPADGQPEGI